MQNGDESAELYSVEVRGEGITVSKSIPADIARAIVNLVMGGNISTLPPKRDSDGGGTFVPGRVAGERVSLREYLDESGATHNPDKILVIGSYLTDQEGTQDFSRDDIKARFRTAGEAPPANYHRDFANAVRQGWVAEDPNNRSHFFVTQKGRAAIAAKFSAEVKKAVKAKPSRRSRKRSTASGSSEGNES